MQAIGDFFHTLGPWNWFIAGGILLALEAMVPGVYLLWFGLAAFIAGALALAAGLGWPAQILAFAAAAVALLFFVRRFGGGSPVTDSPDLNVRAAQYVGRVVTVEDAIADGRGKVRVGDTVWLAKGPDMPSGARARVTAADGATLVIEAAG